MLLKGAGATAALLAGWTRPRPTGAGAGQLGYAFGLAQNDVSVFSVATRQVLDTRPLGVPVRWLANAQRFWDGRSIWTYTFGMPTDPVQVIAIDPGAVRVTRTIDTGGTGPAHSVMLTPDLRRAWVNIAGDNVLDEVDLARGEVVGRVETGHFP